MGNSKNPDMTIEEMQRMYNEAVTYAESCKLAADNSIKRFCMCWGVIIFITLLIGITKWVLLNILLIPFSIVILTTSLIGRKYKCNIATIKVVKIYVEKIAKIPITLFGIVGKIPFISFIFGFAEMVFRLIAFIIPYMIVISYAPLAYYLAHRFYKNRKETIEPMLK